MLGEAIDEKIKSEVAWAEEITLAIQFYNAPPQLCAWDPNHSPHSIPIWVIGIISMRRAVLCSYLKSERDREVYRYYFHSSVKVDLCKLCSLICSSYSGSISIQKY